MLYFWLVFVCLYLHRNGFGSACILRYLFSTLNDCFLPLDSLFLRVLCVCVVFGFMAHHQHFVSQYFMAQKAKNKRRKWFNENWFSRVPYKNLVSMSIERFNSINTCMSSAKYFHRAFSLPLFLLDFVKCKLKSNLWNYVTWGKRTKAQIIKINKIVWIFFLPVVVRTEATFTTRCIQFDPAVVKLVSIKSNQKCKYLILCLCCSFKPQEKGKCISISHFSHTKLHRKSI